MLIITENTKNTERLSLLVTTATITSLPVIQYGNHSLFQLKKKLITVHPTETAFNVTFNVETETETEIRSTSNIQHSNNV